jgi:superfamily II DNA/RNA helicase
VVPSRLDHDLASLSEGGDAVSTPWFASATHSSSFVNSRTEAERRLLAGALGVTSLHHVADPALRFSAEALEIAVLDVLNDQDRLEILRGVAADAFELFRVLPRPTDPIEAGKFCLRTGCLAVLADKTRDAVRLFTENPWPELPLNSANWGQRTYSTVLDVWLRLIRKNGWQDLDAVFERVIALRQEQQEYEARYLEVQEESARRSAWELTVLYHLSRAAEIVAQYSATGEVEGRFDVVPQIEAQFDRALVATGRGDLLDLNFLVQLIGRTARQLIENSLWSITRGAPVRVGDFVRSLLARNRVRPIFEVLPPQRRALREEGLLGTGFRAVVVNLPTSSGKTLIAQFRVLQALNQFEQQRGWVAYVAPTRTLVNQIATRLRRDFSSIGIVVEKVNPALEVDGLEATLLLESAAERQFRVLVTTPEKLDLLLRGGWEEQINRPLTLVVVDEAHNLAQKQRGIKLELLLATINRECKFAQFLLLTPFIHNAGEIATWLSPDNHKDVELGLDWQPNDRAIALSQAVRLNGKGKAFGLELETIHTTKNTIAIPEKLRIGGRSPLGMTFSRATQSASSLAAATAQVLKERGPVVVLSSRPDWAWSLAERFQRDENRTVMPSEGVRLVQRFLESEIGKDFLLTDLLNYGIAVHHSGLSDEIRLLMEWLFETEQVRILVATTTIAQGVNFPVSGVVLAQNKYYNDATGSQEEMPPEDFWNLAGRAGRADQGTVGIVALAAVDDKSGAELKTFVRTQVGALNSTLVQMVQAAMSKWGELQLAKLSSEPEWSAFLQYLAHTYRQMNSAEKFAMEVEQVLRGTLGFQALRRINLGWANQLVRGVQQYGERLAGKPLKLVDNTGFSWETVNATLARLSESKVTADVWRQELFGQDNKNLRDLMGILLRIPELRDNLAAATGGKGADGDKLASMVSDWVNGIPVRDMASKYFGTDIKGNKVDDTTAFSNCCRNLFGRLTQTASWGLAALQSMTWTEALDRLPPEQQQTLRNLPARVFYGVNTDAAVALRMVGVPRGAAGPLAKTMGAQITNTPLADLRSSLETSDDALWQTALGAAGKDYKRVWRLLEGLA